MMQRGDLIVRMSEQEARQAESEIIRTADRLRSLLLAFYEGQGYLALGYSSYTAWGEAIAPRMFGMTGRHIARELTAAIIEREIVTLGTGNDAIPEKQMRPLGAFVDRGDGRGADQKPIKVDGDSIRAAWQEANERANGRPTGAIVAQVVQEIRAAPARAPMAVHYSSETPEWYTPAQIIGRTITMLGAIDLDPCSNATGAAANVPAGEHYTMAMDGLARRWHGRVYMNPPYGDMIAQWVRRMFNAYGDGEIESGIALLPARTDTQWFQPLIAVHPICFVRGRLTFVGAAAPAPFPSAIVYFGRDRPRFVEYFGSLGAIA